MSSPDNNTSINRSSLESHLSFGSADYSLIEKYSEFDIVHRIKNAIKILLGGKSDWQKAEISLQGKIIAKFETMGTIIGSKEIRANLLATRLLCSLTSPNYKGLSLPGYKGLLFKPEEGQYETNASLEDLISRAALNILNASSPFSHLNRPVVKEEIDVVQEEVQEAVQKEVQEMGQEVIQEVVQHTTEANASKGGTLTITRPRLNELNIQHPITYHLNVPLAKLFASSPFGDRMNDVFGDGELEIQHRDDAGSDTLTITHQFRSLVRTAADQETEVTRSLFSKSSPLELFQYEEEFVNGASIRVMEDDESDGSDSSFEIDSSDEESSGYVSDAESVEGEAHSDSLTIDHHPHLHLHVNIPENEKTEIRPSHAVEIEGEGELNKDEANGEIQKTITHNPLLHASVPETENDSVETESTVTEVEGETSTDEAASTEYESVADRLELIENDSIDEDAFERLMARWNKA